MFIGIKMFSKCKKVLVRKIVNCQLSIINCSKGCAVFAVAAAILCGLLNPMTASAECSSVSISADNRTDIENGINALIEKNKAFTPSVSITVFDDKQDICSVVYGSADMENGAAADENTVYEWGSISKTLVWTSAMQLYERGMLDLNGDIRGLLPEGFLKKLKYDEPITMLDLMNHSAGFLSPYKDMETANVDEIMTLEDALREIEPAQVYCPGEVIAYSNYGAALAGYVVERVSGMDFADYVKVNIFDRLGMEHTAIRPDLSDNEWVAEQRVKTHCCVRGADGLESLGECRRYIHIYPAGGACGTISDLALFAKSFLCDSKDCPLFDKDETLDEMLAPSLYFADGKTPRSCHGLQTEIAGTTLLGHGGNTEGFTSLMQFDITGKTGFVMMINKQSDGTYSRGLNELFYGALEFPETADGFTEYDISGHYILTGGMFETGCFSAYGFLTDRMYIEKRDGEYVCEGRGIVSAVQISDNAARVKLITGNEYLFFIRADGGKVRALENDLLDFVRVSEFEYYLGWVILALMFAGMAVLTVLAVIHFIQLRKHTSSERSFKLIEALTGACAAAIAAATALLAVLGYESSAARTVICVSIAVLSAALSVGTIINIIGGIRGKLGKRVFVLECLCAVFIVVGVVYWRLYQYSC